MYGDSSVYKCEVCGMHYESEQNEKCPHYIKSHATSKMSKRIRRLSCKISKFFFNL